MFTSYPKGIHALPVELLTRVFVLGAEDDDPYKFSPFLLKPDQNYYAVPSTLFQLTASHVCRHWRHVALRTPALWTTLCFREQSHIPRAAAYLQRCTRSPSRRLDILVDTVAPKDHVPGVTLCRDELTSIFDLICPHVPNWRAFHLKIRDDTCKQIARKYLGNAPPAPHLHTLQLYHFEDFRVAQDLYIATYRRPVSIFSNSLPKLRNVSLIGVNLPWDASPYLHSLHTLELALHSDHTRPPYTYWDRMLRLSPHLQRLLLHYSGPRAENGTEDLAWATQDYSFLDSSDSPHPYSTHAAETEPKRNGKGKAKQVGFDNKDDGRILLESLWELSLTDLDPDYLCRVLQRLLMPSVNKLSLHLPDQDFTPFVQLIVPPPPLLHLHEHHEHESMSSTTTNTPCGGNHGHGTVSTQLPGSGLGPGGDAPRFASGSGFSWLSEEQRRKFPVILASSSAQTPMFQTIESPSPPEIMTIPVHTSPASSSNSLPASLTSSIKSALSSISPSTMTTASTSPMISGPSSSTVSASRNMNIMNTNSISVNSLASFGSASTSTSYSGPSTSQSQTRPGSSLPHPAHSMHSTSSSHLYSAPSSSTLMPASSSASAVPIMTATMNNDSFIANQRHWPLPRLSTTLHTLIITALDCEFNAWRLFLATLEGVKDLEVNFHKVHFTGIQRRKCGGGNEDLAYRVLLDRVGVDCVAGCTVRTRMVLPLLKKCKIVGLSGVYVRRLVEGRERGSRGTQRVEWLVVEDKNKLGDDVLTEVLENGVHIAEETKWVKVQRFVEDEEDEDEGEGEGEGEDEDEGEGEEESESEVEEEEAEREVDEEEASVDEVRGDHGEYGAGEEVVDDDSAEEEEVNVDDEAPTTVTAAEHADAAGEAEKLQEQCAYYLGAQFTATSTVANDVYTTGTKYRTSSVGGSSTSSGLASGISGEGFSSSSSISTNAADMWKGSTRRGDGHRGME